MSRPGKSSKLLYDQGTSFRAGDRELQEAFEALHPTLNTSQKYKNRSVKAALSAALCLQVIKEVLVEIEGILSSKPLSYVSSDLAVPIEPQFVASLPTRGQPDEGTWNCFSLVH